MYWTTDLHTEFYSNIQFEELLGKMSGKKIVITGDIDSNNLFQTMKKMLEVADVYFVCGNHDYYGKYLSDFNYEMRQDFPSNYLEAFDGIETENEYLIGGDGWYDGVAGEYNSRFSLYDFNAIPNFIGFSRSEIFRKMYRQAKVSNDGIIFKLESALKKYDNIILATHVPPFIENSTFGKKQSSLESLPFFCNKTLGRSLIDIMDKFTNKKLTVLCGHTHDFSRNIYGHNKNIRCVTKKAEYGVIDDFIDLEYL